eukprot:COSAG01_NODE_555_length_15533_cov_35.243310_13_plen_40_part_00
MNVCCSCWLRVNAMLTAPIDLSIALIIAARVLTEPLNSG